jgi:hypothetical protein
MLGDDEVTILSQITLFFLTFPSGSSPMNLFAKYLNEKENIELGSYPSTLSE